MILAAIQKSMIVDVWAFPMSVIVALVFLIGIYLFRAHHRDSRLYTFITGHRFVVLLMTVVALATAVQGTWNIDLMHHPVSIALVLVMLFSLALCTIDGLTKKIGRSYTLSHLGFFLIIYGAVFGAPDFSNSHMRVSRDISSSYASSDDGLTLPLPMKIQLKDFFIDYYEDGISPKQYTSILDIDGKTKFTSVNHPCIHKGFIIYQSDYDHINKEYSVVGLVRDPWLPLTFLGMLLLAIGAVSTLKLTWHSKSVIPVVFALAVIFTVLSLARIRLGTLMPALRSFWFVPHLIIYMLAYSLLAVSLICGVLSLFGKQSAGDVSLKLLGTVSSLLILGMLCGAVWAKLAWGDYWTWDAKECWAAATWIITLIGSHLPSSGKHKYLYVAVILLAFLSMQVTWYGVNYLPSAQFSMHTYNL